VAVEPTPESQECWKANVRSHAEWLAANDKPAAAAPQLVAAACGDGSCDKLVLTIYDQ